MTCPLIWPACQTLVEPVWLLMPQVSINDLSLNMDRLSSFDGASEAFHAPLQYKGPVPQYGDVAKHWWGQCGFSCPITIERTCSTIWAGCQTFMGLVWLFMPHYSIKDLSLNMGRLSNVGGLVWLFMPHYSIKDLSLNMGRLSNIDGNSVAFHAPLQYKGLVPQYGQVVKCWSGQCGISWPITV